MQNCATLGKFPVSIFTYGSFYWCEFIPVETEYLVWVHVIPFNIHEWPVTYHKW